MKLASGIAPVASAAGRRRQRRPRHRRRRVQQPPRPAFRDAPREPARQGVDRRRRRACPRATVLAMATLNGARALGFDDVRPARSCPGRTRTSSRSTSAASRRSPCSIRCRISSTSPGAATSATCGCAGVEWSTDGSLTTIDEAGDPRAHAHLAAQTRSHDLAHATPGLDAERRPRRAREVLRHRASLVGSRERVSPAARDQSAAARLDRAVGGRASRARTCSTSAAAAASCPRRWRAAAPRSRASTFPTKALGVARLHGLESGIAVDYRLVAAEALAARVARTLRRRHVHGDARARARSRVDRRRVRDAGRAGRDASCSPRSTATRSRTCWRSSAPSTCCACCRAARTTGRASSGRRSSPASRGARASRSPA